VGVKEAWEDSPARRCARALSLLGRRERRPSRVRCHPNYDCSNAGCPGTSRAAATFGCPIGATLPAPRYRRPAYVPPLRMIVAACKLGVGGRRLRALGWQRNATTAGGAGRRRAGRGRARCASAARLPPLRLRIAACKLLGGGGVALGRSGSSDAAQSCRRRRRAAPNARAGKRRRRRRRPTCLDCTWALLPASWEVGASP